MSLAMDETAADLPVRDVGLRGLMPVMQDSVRGSRSWKRSQVLKIKDHQRVFRVPREQLEDQCLSLLDENKLLKQHTHTQEQKLRRMSTKLIRLRHGGPASAADRDAEMEDTILELEARVSTLECQKGALQKKLILARQHILDMGVKSHYRPQRGRVMDRDGEGGVPRAAQTAPACYNLSSMEGTRAEIQKFRSSVIETQHVRVTELELAAQSLRDTLKEKEREIEGTMKELRRQQADEHRITIKDNMDMIHLQKQLSEKSAALLVIQGKFNALQEGYEAQLEEGQRSLQESQGSLLKKVEELSEKLKQKKQRALALEGQLATATLSLQGLEELRERVADLEGERNLLKQSYNTLLESTLSAQSHQQHPGDKEREMERLVDGRERLAMERERLAEERERLTEGRERLTEGSWRAEVRTLEERLAVEREEREKLEEKKQRMAQEKERIEGKMEREREMNESLREKHRQLEQEVLQHRQDVTSLQERLDSVTQEFGMSVEDLSETLLQIKVFRLQQVSREGMHFLRVDGKVEDLSREMANTQASHAETVLELQKTRDILLLQHRLNTDLQAELKTVMDRSEREREENNRRVGEKDRLLMSRARQINTLQAQLKELAYSPRNYNRTIPQQYTWAGGDQELVQPLEDDTIFSQLRGGESLLEIHLAGAAFTPGSLRRMAQARGEDAGSHQKVVTFCTYALLDFETHSTPLISGGTPNYGFTSRYTLAPRDLGRLGGQGATVPAELHQALGGVRFVTRGQAQVPLVGAVERRGERVSGRANITAAEGEIIGVLEFWVRLYPPAELADTQMESTSERVTDRRKAHRTLGWGHSGFEAQELYDFGGGIPNELEVVLRRCMGLSARWPGLLPDAYLTYRLYDLPPHTTPTVTCSAEPVFEDAASYPLAVTADVTEYLQAGSLWVYLFDDSEGQTPPAYLAKTPIPLRALATGRPIRGDYVLRDSAGGPRGVVRVSLGWRYPFQPPRRQRETDRPAKERERADERAETPQRPIAKPRTKTKAVEPKVDKSSKPREPKAQPQSRPPPIRVLRAKPLQSPEPTHMVTPLQSPERKRATRRAAALSSPEPDRVTAHRSPMPPTPHSRRSLASNWRTQEGQSEEEEVEEEEEEDEEEEEERSDTAQLDSKSDESRASTGSDVIVIPRSRKPVKRGNKLRVEILSLTFDPDSHVALDQSVQRVYVEYRLLGVPMETTETPTCLRKPTEGEEVHYNFTRVIYVDHAEAAPLRHYLYTMLEGSDPNQGRLKFTVVSEPMNEEEECIDVGHAYLDLQELLLTGSDVIERQIDIVSLGEEKEVVGKLKVSLEAAKTLTGIYQQYHQRKERESYTVKEAEEVEEEEEEEEEEDEEDDTAKKSEEMQVADDDTDAGDDGDDFF